MEFIKREPKIYILSGKSGSGKSFVASKMKKHLKDKKVIVISYASYLKEYIKNISNWDGNDETKPRDFLQQLGVELIKNQINDKFLINRIIEDIKVYSYFSDVIIISDARFPEEIKDIKNNFNDVTVINICGVNNNLNNEQKKHITETALNEFADYDYVINNKNKEEIDYKIKEILEVI